MAKPTIASLTAQLEALRLANTMLEERLESAKKHYRAQALTIEGLKAQLAEPQPKAAWQPSTKLSAAKELAMATGRCVRV